MTGPHNPDDFTDVLYKYTDFNGAQKTLSTGKLRFTRPSQMNDPFDVRIDQWLPMDVSTFYELVSPRLIDQQLSRPEEYPKLRPLIEEFQSQPEHGKTAMLKEMEFVVSRLKPYFLPKLQRSTDEIRSLFAASFDTYGIFCATRTFRNLLMWAHYADKHGGAVLGFQADLEMDSMLRLTKPVRYSKLRPHAIDTPEEFIANLDIAPNLMARRIADKLFHTKSAEWDYEQEVRLLMPDGVADGEIAGHYPFLYNELKEVYLGCRMTTPNKEEIIRLANAINPDVRIFAARLAEREYTLDFDPV